MDELGHLGWVAERAYDIGGLLFGVRTNSRAAGFWLDETLEEYRAVDEEVDPYFSIVLGENGKSLGKRFHLLYRESEVVMRTHDVGELGRAFLAELEVLTFRHRDDAVYVQSALVSRDGAVALIPAMFMPPFDQIRRRVAAAGVSLPLSEYTAIDLDSAQAIPIRSTLGFDTRAVERLTRAAAANGGAAGRWVLDQPMHVDAVCALQHLEKVPIQPLSRAAALYQLALGAPNLRRVGYAGIRALAQLVEEAQCFRLMADYRQEMLSYVVDVLDRVRRPTAVLG